MADPILEYLIAKYQPIAIISYGSFNDLSRTERSDYDALLILEDGIVEHDMEIVNNVQLDVFIYPRANIESLDCYENLIQIWDGTIVKDAPDGIAEKLLQNVNEAIQQQPFLSYEEKCNLKNWSLKMMEHGQHNGSEKGFRHQWLLEDSLKVYCNLRDLRYYGPKKAIYRMRVQDWEGYCIYQQALKSEEGLLPWIDYVFLPLENPPSSANSEKSEV